MIRKKHGLHLNKISLTNFIKDMIVSDGAYEFKTIFCTYRITHDPDIDHEHIEEEILDWLNSRWLSRKLKEVKNGQ